MTIHKNHNNLIVTSSFQNLLQICLNIFQEFDLGNLRFEKILEVKKINVLKEKKFEN